MKKELLEYLKDYMFSEEAKEIINSSEIINGEGFNVWSFKKMIFLEYYIKPYLLLIKKNATKVFFIDFFSGCGANEAGENKPSIGSPIISLLKGSFSTKNKIYMFDKWYFAEINKEKADALNKRIDQTLKEIELKNKIFIDRNQIETLGGDINFLINKIVENLNNEVASGQKVGVLAFIDPYNYSNLEWATLDKLLNLKYVDIIYTFPVLALKRGFDSDLCKEKDKYLSPSLKEICKTKKLCEISPEDFSGLYAKDIAKKVRRSICYFDRGISAKNSLNGEIYRIELFTNNETMAKICEGKVKELNQLNFFHLNNIIYQAMGKQKTLFN
ncbi:MAG: three-Cys-motif partner protein TcmP [Nanoarchaeota archaeon]|nr:three-Cys-motif partner protein TcmP [Nanoarchaeota archaeon]